MPKFTHAKKRLNGGNNKAWRIVSEINGRMKIRRIINNEEVKHKYIKYGIDFGFEGAKWELIFLK